MATNHTTNYQLNQWKATDQVLHTDFNQDNLKIDVALKAHEEALTAETSAREELKERLEAVEEMAGSNLISSYSVPALCTTCTIPLELEWSEWHSISILLDPYTSGQGILKIYAGDGGDLLGLVPSNEAGDERHLYCLRLLLLPVHSAEGFVHAVSLYDGAFRTTGMKFAEMRSLRVECPEGCSLTRSTTAQIWGQK